MRYALTCCVLLSSAASADCPERLQRDPTFVALAVDDKAPRPSSAADFNFVGNSTTFDALQAKVGPPDGAKGEHRYLWCLASGTIVEVELFSYGDVRAVRVDGKTIYKRK